MPHFSQAFSRLARAGAQPMLRRYSGHPTTVSGQSKNNTTTDKKKSQDNSSGNSSGTRDLPIIRTHETPNRMFRLEDNFIQVTKEIGMKRADLRADYCKIQSDIGAVKWQIGVLLGVIAGAGSSLLAYLVTKGLSKLMQENQRNKTEGSLYEKLEKFVQETNYKHQQEAPPVKKAGE